MDGNTEVNLGIQMVEARGFGGSYLSRCRLEITDVSDKVVGQSAIAPSIYIEDKIFQMRQAPCLSLSQRLTRLKLAGSIFENGILAGLDRSSYTTLVSNVTGLDSSIVERSLSTISNGLIHMNEIISVSTPQGAVWDINSDRVKDGCSLFSRRGNILAVIASGNGPGVHGYWPQAIAMGYRVLIKPSSREPFTPLRMVIALEKAGLADYVLLVPTDHKGTETLIAQSDLAIIYGGESTVEKYRNNNRILVMGPGRSKIVVGKDACLQSAASLAAKSVTSHGGAACVSTSAILVEGDVNLFTQLLRQEIKYTWKSSCSKRFRRGEVQSLVELLQSDDIPLAVEESNDGFFQIVPHVLQVTSAKDPRVQRELPFPCVTIAPFGDPGSYEALRESLVVTVLTKQQKLIDKILSDSSISNVYIGNILTTWMDYKVPHDGFLSDFLMRNRGVKVDVVPLKG